MSDPKKLQVHLSDSGTKEKPVWRVEIMAHPSAAKRNVHVIFDDVEIHNWRNIGGEADQAKWTSREIDMHADDAEPADEREEHAHE